MQGQGDLVGKVGVGVGVVGNVEAQVLVGGVDKDINDIKDFFEKFEFLDISALK